ncbi:MAG: LuxR C-terminal-related transcriptional regulator [Polyangiaceae bacterium]
MHSTLLDVVPLIEAAYRVEQSTTDWLQGLLEAADPILNDGAGLHAFRFDRDESGQLAPRDPLCFGATEDWTAHWRVNWWDRWIAPLDQPTMEKVLSFGACSYATQLWASLAAEIPTYEEFLSELARRGYAHVLRQFASSESEHTPQELFYPDSFNLVATDIGMSATVLLANRKTPANAGLPPDEIEVWERVTAHITAGARLQRRIGAHGAHASVEAVLSPDGRVLHAEGDARKDEARELLRNAARRVDEARSKRSKRDASSTLSLWRALYDETWSVFDHFDADGRRYLIARRNKPEAQAHATLSEREQQVAAFLALGHSNKAIAYELGAATSTVATHVAKLKKHYGVSSRAALVRAIREPGSMSATFNSNEPST